MDNNHLFGVVTGLITLYRAQLNCFSMVMSKHRGGGGKTKTGFRKFLPASRELLNGSSNTNAFPWCTPHDGAGGSGWLA